MNMYNTVMDIYQNGEHSMATDVKKNPCNKKEN